VQTEFTRFLAVGVAGFAVDGGLLAILTSLVGVPVLAARLVSFFIAVTVTWLLNRRLTFRHRASRRRIAEWWRYVTVNGIGGVINLVIFATLIWVVPWLNANPLMAFAIASAIALIFNFLGSRAIAFRPDTVATSSQDAVPPPR
jgi:putative flippase GtrA